MYNTLTDKKDLIPAFEKDNNLIIFSSDNNYAPYLGVSIKSLVANGNTSFNYDIVVLEDNITDNNKRLILQIADDYVNVSVRFFNMNVFAENHRSLFFTKAQYSVAAYYRLFIPEIFYQYKKALYLDCDMIIEGDVSVLLQMDMKDKLIVAAPDLHIIYHCKKKTIFPYIVFQNIDILYTYIKDVLKIEDFNSYFNSGVMLLDIPRLKNFNMIEKCIKRLEEIVKPFYVDQDILNSVFYGNVGFMDIRWNHFCHIDDFSDFKGNVPDELLSQFVNARNGGACIYHYTADKKPWVYPDWILAEHFWKYALQTPFYEQIIKSLIRFVVKPEFDSRLAKKSDDEVYYVMNHRFRFSLKKIIYRIKLFICRDKEKHQRYFDKYNNLQNLLKEAKLLKKRMNKI